MSRLHLILKNGADKTPLPKHMQTAECQTVGDRLDQLTGDNSPRFGNRTKILLKTARACGSNATPVLSWGARKQGEAGKAQMFNRRRAQTSQAKKMKRGDK